VPRLFVGTAGGCAGGLNAGGDEGLGDGAIREIADGATLLHEVVECVGTGLHLGWGIFGVVEGDEWGVGHRTHQLG